MLGKWYDAKFIRVEKVNANVKRFWVEIAGLDEIKFIPGQFMTFDMPIHEKRHKRWRSYSIASAPGNSNVLEFVIVFLEGGDGTEYLFNDVQEGVSLKLRGPLGKFVLPKNIENNQELCLICTGTGLAPFRSMLLDMVNKKEDYTNKPSKIHLIYGTRTSDNILYREEMESLSNILPGFQYHITLSRPDETWQGRKGYVHPVYEEIYADKRDAVFMLCGWNNMLDEAKERLQDMGYDKKNIIYESYG